MERLSILGTQRDAPVELVHAVVGLADEYLLVGLICNDELRGHFHHTSKDCLFLSYFQKLESHMRNVEGNSTYKAGRQPWSSRTYIVANLRLSQSWRTNQER